MDFNLTNEQRAFRETVSKFMTKEVLPLTRTPESEHLFLSDIWLKMGKLGLLGMGIPEEYGGTPVDSVTFAIAIETISKAHTSLAFSLGPHTSFVGNTISQYGSQEQKKKYLPGIASGKLIGAGGWTEPEAGSDVRGIKTSALKENGYYVVNGSKTLITNAPIADLFVTLVVTDKSTQPPGMTCLLFERDVPGIRFGKDLEKMGVLGSPTGEIFFEDCRIPEKNRLGDENEGFSILMKTFQRGRIGMAALCLGTAVACFEASIKYAKVRKAFGQAISNFQAIKFKLADMKKNIDAARLLILRAAWMYDQGKPIEMESAVAKLFASEMSVECALDAVQIHGGYGYMKEYLVERHLRDVVINTIGEGTSEIQRLIIARNILKRYG